MVDMIDIGQNYSVELFQKDARCCIDKLLAKGYTPILCGGTGLYLDAVIDEMSFPSGEANSPARKHYEAIYAEQGAEVLYGLLVKRDPEGAKLIHPHNVRRIIRALEMCDEGLSYAQENASLHKRIPHYDCRMWGIRMDRTKLYAHIDARVDAMFAAGLVQEVEHLRAEGLANARTARQAIGYKEVLRYLEGDCSFEEAQQNVKSNTRHYAKRQLSWLRRDGRLKWLNYDEIDESQAAELILEDLKGSDI
jgi:tRNA dimethylallyltransferase